MAQLQRSLQLVKTFDNILKFTSGKTRRRENVFNAKKTPLIYLCVILCQSVIIDICLYSLSLSRRERENNNIAIMASCGRNMWFTNFTRKNTQAPFKRGTLKWKDGRILAESCTEQGSAVTCCICHFSCNRENVDEGTENEKRKELQEQLSCSGPWNKRLIERWQVEDHKHGWKWCGHH